MKIGPRGFWKKAPSQLKLAFAQTPPIQEAISFNTSKEFVVVDIVYFKEGMLRDFK
jgi:hypothetical protein